MDHQVSAYGESADTIFHHERLYLPTGEREKLYRSVLESSLLDPEYLTMLALSGLIALFGLLQNSVAVIIGAMLISPLMNPILAAALALLLGDGRLGRKAAIVLGISVTGVIAITALVTWLSPLKEITPEVLARTNPNLLDLFIAFLSGLAGTLALRSAGVSLTIIPGVAIAVAVVPPLAVVGFSLSTHHGAMAWGGFLLFVTNLVSIMISAAVVFRLMGFSPRERGEEGRVKLQKRMAVSALILVVLAVPLVQTLRRAVTQLGLRSEVESVVQGVFKTDHSAVTDLTYSQVGNSFRVQVTLRTTQYFDATHIGAAQKALRDHFGSNTQLTVDQILVAQGGLTAEQIARMKDFISGGTVQPVAKEEPFDLKATQEKITNYLQKQVDDVLIGTSIRRAEPVQAQLGGNTPLVLNLHLIAPEPLDEQTVRLLASQLSAKVSSPVELHGEIKLEKPDFSLALQSRSVQNGLAQQDRVALTRLATSLLTRPDLNLRASMSAGDIDADALKASRLWRDVSGILSQSRLKDSQWSIQIASAPVDSSAEGTTSRNEAHGDKQKDAVRNEGRGPALLNVNVYQVL